MDSHLRGNDSASGGDEKFYEDYFEKLNNFY